MPEKRLWKKCDELNWPFYLASSDSCFYHEEFFEGKYNCSTGNQFVSNFKKDISKKGTPEWYHKQKAISDFADLLAHTKFPKGTGLIAAPTSKPRSSLIFDSRIDDVLQKYHAKNADVQISFCLDAVYEEIANHLSKGKSRNPDVIIKNMRLLPTWFSETIHQVFVIDDVITTGGHFVAAKRLINERYPEIVVNGLFLALRIHSPPPEIV